MITCLLAALVTLANGDVRFGDNRISVVFDRESGFPVEYQCGDVPVLEREPSWPSPVAFTAEKPWEDKSSFVEMKKVGTVQQSARDEAKSTMEGGGWRVTTSVKLLPERKMVRRRFEITWIADGTGKLERVWFAAGRVPCAAGKGGYMLPIRYPTVRRSAKVFCPGWADAQSYKFGSHSPIIAFGSSGYAMLACTDETVPWGDRSRTWALERKEAVAISTLFQSYGWMPKGVPQTIGDQWLTFRKGDDETMLLSMHEWFDVVGQHVLSDRPESIKDTILYSDHPQSAGNILGWRKADLNFIAGFLPYVKALGCNTVWMRPIEDEHPYCPRDYYKLQANIGTEDDFKRYVAKAHELGLKVWRDAVGHGGRNDSPRAKEHPEWLYHHEDGSTDSFWCYDMFQPGWLKWFGDFIAHDTRKYMLDGWRMDAVSGARFPNWAPDIPYGRASFAQEQGSLAIMRAIRDRARAANPNAVTLAEAWYSVAATRADAIYDEWGIPLRFMNQLAYGDVALAVMDYRRYLHERQHAIVPDSVVLRFNENHDHVDLDSRAGATPSVAAFAVQAWSDGIPMLREFGGFWYFERCREILRTKAALEELRRGSADYVSVRAPDGVFAALRQTKKLASVVLANFNPVPVKGKVEAPGYKPFEIELAPYEYEVRRVKGPSVAEAMGPRPSPFEPDTHYAVVLPKNDPCAQIFELDIGTRKVKIRAELKAADSGFIWRGYKLALERAGKGWRLMATNQDGGAIKGARLFLQIPDAGRWFAHTAEGEFGGPEVIPVSATHGSHSYVLYRKVDGAVIWSNHFHPFGFSPAYANVGCVVGDKAVVFGGFDNGDLVEIRSRIGADNGLAVSVAGSKTELRFAVLDESVALAKCRPATGDDRLRVAAGGWEYDDGKFKMRIRKSGAIASIWKRVGGKWKRITAEGDIYTTTGSGVQSNVGDTFRLCRQMWTLDAHIVFRKLPDGRMQLTFDEAGMRAEQLNQGSMAKPIFCKTTFTLGDPDGFGWCNDVSTSRELKPEEGKLRVGIRAFMGGKPQLSFKDVKMFGAVEAKPTSDDGILGFTWLDATTETLPIVNHAGVECFVSLGGDLQ